MVLIDGVPKDAAPPPGAASAAASAAGGGAASPAGGGAAAATAPAAAAAVAPSSASALAASAGPAGAGPVLTVSGPGTLLASGAIKIGNEILFPPRACRSVRTRDSDDTVFAFAYYASAYCPCE